MNSEYYVVKKDILPDYLLKVVEVRKALETQKYSSVIAACKAYGISRSTYYKYKDDVYAVNKTLDRKAVLSLTLTHQAGILAKVCQLLSDLDVSILTISQALPIGDKADVVISCDISRLVIDCQDLINELKKIDGVSKGKLLAIE